MKKIAADRNYKIASALPEGAVKNPESYTLPAGETYLVQDPRMPKDMATLYVKTPGGKAIAYRSIRLTQNQQRALGVN